MILTTPGREKCITVLYFFDRRLMNYARSFTSCTSLIRVPANINPELIVEAHRDCALLPQGRAQASPVPSSHLDIILNCVGNA